MKSRSPSPIQIIRGPSPVRSVSPFLDQYDTTLRENNPAPYDVYFDAIASNKKEACEALQNDKKSACKAPSNERLCFLHDSDKLREHKRQTLIQCRNLRALENISQCFDTPDPYDHVKRIQVEEQLASVCLSPRDPIQQRSLISVQYESAFVNLFPKMLNTMSRLIYQVGKYDEYKAKPIEVQEGELNKLNTRLQKRKENVREVIAEIVPLLQRTLRFLFDIKVPITDIWIRDELELGEQLQDLNGCLYYILDSNNRYVYEEKTFEYEPIKEDEPPPLFYQSAPAQLIRPKPLRVSGKRKRSNKTKKYRKSKLRTYQKFYNR